MLSNPNNCKRLILPAALLLAAAAALTVDVPVALAFRNWNKVPAVHYWLRQFDMFEMFGYGLGMLFLVFVLHQLDPRRRWAIPRVLACAIGAGGLANLVKLLIARTRPAHAGLTDSVWTTFGDWFSAIEAGAKGQSFPSAHTATAAGFAMALIWLYPQGRFIFTLLAVLVGCQRIISGAHYLSDVLAGGATGCIAALLILYIGLLPGWLSRWEQSWGRSPERE